MCCTCEMHCQILSVTAQLGILIDATMRIVARGLGFIVLC